MEVAPDGRENLLLRLEFWSYRGVPGTWTGVPGGVPALVASRKGAVVEAYASWNGATRIQSWQLLAGQGANALSPVGAPVPFADLETRLSATTSAPFVAVRALDAAGRPLGQSRAVGVG
jgi:hypothetical protein